NDDTGAAEYQDPHRDDGLLFHTAAAGNADHGGDRPDGVGNVVGTVGKGHGAGGHDHQHAEYALDGVVVELGIVQVGIGDAHDEDRANAGNHAADQYRQGIGVRRVEIDADMLEALEHGDQGHEEP